MLSFCIALFWDVNILKIIIFIIFTSTENFLCDQNDRVVHLLILNNHKFSSIPLMVDIVLAGDFTIHNSFI